MSTDSGKRSFREVVCHHFGCAPEAYEETVFRHCLYPHAAWLSWLIRRFDAGYFESDFQLIRYVANMTEVEDLRTEIRVHRAEHPPATVLRRFLRVRLSGGRVLALSHQLLSPPSVEASRRSGVPGP